jgi:hypothetical protein
MPFLISFLALLFSVPPMPYREKLSEKSIYSHGCKLPKTKGSLLNFFALTFPVRSAYALGGKWGLTPRREHEPSSRLEEIAAVGDFREG